MNHPARSTTLLALVVAALALVFAALTVADAAAFSF